MLGVSGLRATCVRATKKAALPSDRTLGDYADSINVVCPPRHPSDWVMSTVPALVDQTTWDAAHAALAKRLVVRHEAGSAATRDAYLLRGQFTCGHCGGPLACNLGRGKRPAALALLHLSSSQQDLGNA
jgi:hypothetical protein